ncbi:MAG TPA: GNAT family N-acetyltransferase [bacterium]|nr:GNAT family N-acetyltransferase [bacterium]
MDTPSKVLRLPELVAYTADLNTPSRRVMEKLGMMRDPASNFDNRNLPHGHALRPHVVYWLRPTSIGHAI